MSTTKRSFQKSPLQQFREQRGLDRIELLAMCTSAPLASALPTRLAQLESGILHPDDASLVKLWSAMERAGFGDLRTEMVAWFEAHRPRLPNTPAIAPPTADACC